MIAVRCSDPASGVTSGDFAQKLRAKVTRGYSASGVFGRMNESWLPGWRRSAQVVAVRLVELIVVVLRLTEVIDHISQVKEEAGPIRDSGRVRVVGNLIENADLIAVVAGEVGTPESPTA